MFIFRAKEEAKRQQEAFETEQRIRVESQKAEEKAKRERHRQEVEATLPPEPTEGSGDSIAKIRFRLPKGETIDRRFTNKTPLKVLLDFLITKGYTTNEYKVISGWPRKDVRRVRSNETNCVNVVSVLANNGGPVENITRVESLPARDCDTRGTLGSAGSERCFLLFLIYFLPEELKFCTHAFFSSSLIHIFTALSFFFCLYLYIC